jgi:hypothetical protein
LVDPQEAPVDPATSQRVIMSQVFRTEEMSVFMSDQIALSRVQVENPGAFVAQFTVADILKEDCIIMRDPQDYAHGLIYDRTDPGRRISRGQARRIRDAATLIT